MKRILIVLFVFLSIPIAEFAQESSPKIITHEKMAQWPAKSFYQRKSEWQRIIDSTWGPGVSKSQKLQIFDTYANLIQTEFVLFHRLNLNWDSLRTFWRTKITDSTSNGAFHQIMSHFAWSLKDGHSAAWNVAISNAPLNPGTPLFIIPGWHVRDVGHFGACLTATSEGEIFVIRTLPNHPLGLEPGDVIIGYEGVKWMDIVDELMNANIPIFGSSTTTEEARKHDLLISAGVNWHMFSTIDIIKHSTGETLHLSLEPMLQISGEKMAFAEQMEIPGVPKPDYWQNESGSYGIVNGQNIGYIYIYDHINNTLNQIFLEAIKALYNTDGLIIDLRADVGGLVDNNLNSGLDLLINKKINELKYTIRCNPTDLISLCDYSQSWFDFTPNPMTFYQKPIVILTGPGCESMGDITAYRFKSIPNAKFFGRTTAGACGSSDGYYDYPGFGGDYLGWVFYTQVGEFYNPDNPYQYLSGREFPVDKKIWLTKEDVANGDDTVVKEALKWINNLSYCYNAQIDKTYTQDNINFTADVRNPNNHSLSITPYILKNDLVVDSLNCTVTGNKISGTWNVPGSSEAFYSVTVKTKDNVDNTIHTLPNIAKFTTAGPVTLDSITVKKPFPSSYSARPYLHNNGTTTSIANGSVKLICNDPWISNLSSEPISFQLLSPGSSVGSSAAFAFRIIDSLYHGEINFRVEVLNDGRTYWKDSIKVVTGVDEYIAAPSAFKLEQNFPNPFNPNTTIKYGIKERGKVKITIFNIIGKEVALVVNEEMQPGYHKVDFNASNLPSGVYFYQLRAGSFIDTKKMIVLK